MSQGNPVSPAVDHADVGRVGGTGLDPGGADFLSRVDDLPPLSGPLLGDQPLLGNLHEMGIPQGAVSIGEGGLHGHRDQVDVRR